MLGNRVNAEVENFLMLGQYDSAMQVFAATTFKRTAANSSGDGDMKGWPKDASPKWMKETALNILDSSFTRLLGQLKKADIGSARNFSSGDACPHRAMATAFMKAS